MIECDDIMQIITALKYEYNHITTVKYDENNSSLSVMSLKATSTTSFIDLKFTQMN